MNSSVLLVAKDHAASNAVVGEADCRTGRNLWHVPSAHHALEILHGKPGEVDLLIIDVDPVMNGLAVAEALSAFRDLPPLLVVTDEEDLYLTDFSRPENVAACIRKPFDSAELASLI